MKRHTFRDYPFLKEMRKEGWEITNMNKHMLIDAYELGKKNQLSEDTLIEINKRLDIIITILSMQIKNERN